MTDVPYPPHGILTIRCVSMRESLDVPNKVYIPFALYRRGVAIYTNVEANLVLLAIGRFEAETRYLRWVPTRKV